MNNPEIIKITAQIFSTELFINLQRMKYIIDTTQLQRKNSLLQYDVTNQYFLP